MSSVFQLDQGRILGMPSDLEVACHISLSRPEFITFAPSTPDIAKVHLFGIYLGVLGTFSGSSCQNSDCFCYSIGSMAKVTKATEALV